MKKLQTNQTRIQCGIRWGSGYLSDPEPSCVYEARPSRRSWLVWRSLSGSSQALNMWEEDAAAAVLLHTGVQTLIPGPQRTERTLVSLTHMRNSLCKGPMSLRSWNCGHDGVHVNSVHSLGNSLTQIVCSSLQTHYMLDLGNNDGQKYSGCWEELTPS